MTKVRLPITDCAGTYNQDYYKIFFHQRTNYPIADNKATIFKMLNEHKLNMNFEKQHWIKNSPLISSEVMKRILKRIAKDKYIKHCQNIARAKEHFKIQVDEAGNAIMTIGDEQIDVNDFRNEIVSLYGNYFKLK